MIDDNKIEEAAHRFATSQTHGELLALIDGYKEGFKDAINEFLKDLWHPASEEPREFAEVFAEAKITESINTYLSFKRNDALFKNWAAYSSGANITRWLYVDDLFPKKGGEQ